MNWKGFGQQSGQAQLYCYTGVNEEGYENPVPRSKHTPSRLQKTFS